MELEKRFSSEDACIEYLRTVRWPEGFVCSRCGDREAWQTRRGLLHCAVCDMQISVTAGTILHGTRKPLSLWFWAMWYLTNQKYGANALRLQHLQDASRVNLTSFVEGVAQTGSTIRTDDWDGYNNLVDGGYRHVVADSHELNLAHPVTSLLKRWLLGTYQGAVRQSHLTCYFDEFTVSLQQTDFRFSR